MSLISSHSLNLSRRECEVELLPIRLSIGDGKPGRGSSRLPYFLTGLSRQRACSTADWSSRHGSLALTATALNNKQMNIQNRRVFLDAMASFIATIKPRDVIDAHGF